MADELRIDPDALGYAGTEIANHGEALRARHEASHDELRGSSSGWVGASAQALSVLLDAWMSASRTQLERIGRCSSDMHIAAAEFIFMEQRNAMSVPDGCSLNTEPSGSPAER